MPSLKCPYCGWLCYPESYTADTYDVKETCGICGKHYRYDAIQEWNFYERTEELQEGRWKGYVTADAIMRPRYAQLPSTEEKRKKELAEIHARIKENKEV